MRRCDFYKNVYWKDLKVADIVLLRRNEIVPADVLLLDSENEYCMVESSVVDGKLGLTKKKPLKSTSSIL